MSQEIDPRVVVGVRGITDQLTLSELSALYLAMNTDGDPRGRFGYEKAKALFTQNDGTKMHADVRAAFEYIVDERLKNGK